MIRLLKYYIFIIAPLILIYPIVKLENTALMVWFLFIYVIYRGFIDGKRLIDKGILKKEELWKTFIPFYTSRYFRELYFEESIIAMKNFLIYYFEILLPLPLIIMIIVNGKPLPFIIVFIVFYMIMRGFTDGKRLVEKEILKKSEFWKGFIPLYTFLHFRKMYLEI